MRGQDHPLTADHEIHHLLTADQELQQDVCISFGANDVLVASHQPGVKPNFGSFNSLVTD